MPLDGSRLAEQALLPALTLARLAPAHLRLVHVLDAVHSMFEIEGPEGLELRVAARSNAQSYLDRLAAMHNKAPLRDISVNVVEGTPAPCILEEARTWQADLIVMSTHGHGPLDRAWLGSVTDAIVRESHSPTLVIRALDESAPASVPPFAHILIPLDGSALAEQVLAPARALARLTGARITLLQIVHPWVRATRPMAAARPLPGLRKREIERRCAQARTYLAQTAARLEHADIATVVAESTDAREIEQYARQHNVDLLALATHGRSGLKRITLGSVADKLIRGGSAPVLVLRPRETL